MGVGDRLTSERTPEWMADAIVEVLRREKDLLKRFGSRELVLALLNGAEMEMRPCQDRRFGWNEACGSGGRGKVRVTCESSGGSAYDEVRNCENCNGFGEVRRLKFKHPAND